MVSVCLTNAVEFNVDCVAPIAWNHEALESLAIESDRKTILQSLVEPQAFEPKNVVRDSGSSSTCSVHGDY
ncbi:hypothetical protein B0H10DRAFT_2037585 [Mycena sp. CBHHK59/15]|nr:hypothetical protein B0H10DRAFT_2037585 [Mycena sp. CBHHK59/15]